MIFFVRDILRGNVIYLYSKNLHQLFNAKVPRYTAINATDLTQVVDFTSLMQVANKLYQAS